MPLFLGCESGDSSSRRNGIFLLLLPESINFRLDLAGFGLVNLAAYLHAEPQRDVFLHWSQRLPGDLIFSDVVLVEKIGLWSRRPLFDDLFLNFGIPEMLDVCLDRSLLLWWSSGKV